MKQAFPLYYKVLFSKNQCFVRAFFNLLSNNLHYFQKKTKTPRGKSTRSFRFVLTYYTAELFLRRGIALGRSCGRRCGTNGSRRASGGSGICGRCTRRRRTSGSGTSRGRVVCERSMRRRGTGRRCFCALFYRSRFFALIRLYSFLRLFVVAVLVPKIGNASFVALFDSFGRLCFLFFLTLCKALYSLRSALFAIVYCLHYAVLEYGFSELRQKHETDDERHY